MSREPQSECLWSFTRGRTELRCSLLQCDECHYRLDVLRNRRVYGTYRFAARGAALLFADRLRDTFAGNGWVSA